MKTFFNLPEKVLFCKKCVMSNQRPASVPEFKHVRNRDGAKYMQIDENGICDACNQAEAKKSIDWDGGGFEGAGAGGSTSPRIGGEMMITSAF